MNIAKIIHTNVISYLIASLSFISYSSPAKSADPAWWENITSSQMFPIVKMHNTLSTACEITVKNSLYPRNALTITSEAWNSLLEIDPELKIHKDGNRMMILYSGKIIRSFSLPEDISCQSASQFLLAILNSAATSSKIIRETNSDELLEKFVNTYLSNIDAYSHFEIKDRVALDVLKDPASIGIRYRRIGKYLEITDVLPQSPASKNNISVGDRIKEINNVPVANMSRIQVLNALRGENGTSVHLTLRVDGKQVEKDVIRTNVPESSVVYFHDPKNSVTTIKIESFTNTTLKALKSTLITALKKDTHGLIIDLRENIGGSLKAAVLCADLFLPPNLTLIHTYNNVSEHKSYISTKTVNDLKLPIVIIIDGKTASSAEFFAGVLQDYRHAVVIGTPSYGKGVIQTTFPVQSDGIISLTTSKYYLPTDYSPQDKGIYPNVCTAGIRMNTLEYVEKPTTRFDFWRSGNDGLIKTALKECPKEIRKDNPSDDAVALDIIKDPDKYTSSLSKYVVSQEKQDKK